MAAGTESPGIRREQMPAGSMALTLIEAHVTVRGAGHGLSLPWGRAARGRVATIDDPGA